MALQVAMLQLQCACEHARSFLEINTVPGTSCPHLTCAEGDATKVYVSCLVFYDELPQEVLVAHPDLLGHLAPKALCLVTHQPYLATGRRILQQLYTLVFCWGLEVPLAQLVEQVLQVPAPTAGGPPVSILAVGNCCSLALQPSDTAACSHTP
jgi:hypothetical protein